MPYEQDDKRTNRGTDQAGTLVEAIPADQLSDEGGEECACDAEHRRKDKSSGIV
jgi:hypothetical protein